MADWYADMLSGDDTTGDGSSGTPYKTISKCVTSSATTDTIYVKNSADYTEIVTLANSIRNFIGYNSTITDGGVAVIDGASTRANCFALTNTTGNSFYKVANFELKNATGAGYSLVRTGGGSNSAYLLDNIYSHNNNIGILIQANPSVFSFVLRCRVEANTSHGISDGSVDGNWAAIGCHVVNNGGSGIKLASKAIAVDCVVAKNSINIEGMTAVVNCTLDNSDGTDGWVPFAGRYNVAWKTGFTGAAAFGIDSISPGTYLHLYQCGFFSNTSGNVDGTANTNIGEVTTDPKYVDAVNYDFTLDAASPWVQVVGIVGDLASGKNSYGDIGAVQLEVTGGGGGNSNLLHGKLG